MTAQIDDLFQHGGVEFAIAGISEGELFDPGWFGLQPVGICTACWRGYQSVFAAPDDRLVLDALYVNLYVDDEPQQGPPINGVSPTDAKKKHDWFNNHYKHLDYPLECTGGLLLADDFIEELYVHMGFHPAWKYRNVVELIFDEGRLVKEFDRSARMAEIREKLPAAREEGSPSGMPSQDVIRDFVERSFDRTYHLE